MTFIIQLIYFLTVTIDPNTGILKFIMVFLSKSELVNTMDGVLKSVSQ